MQRGERQGVREAIERTAKRLRDSGMSTTDARRRAVESARRIDRDKER